MSGRRRISPEAQARADRIAAALSGLLEDEPPEPSAQRSSGDPYRAVPVAPRSRSPRSSLSCPGCGDALYLEYARGVQIQRCSSCHGLWLDPGELNAMVREGDGAAQVDVPELRRRMHAIAPKPNAVRYRECARCKTAMNRRNFGDHSGVIVDECPSHGVFLDPGEFEAIEAFIRLGGLALQRQRLAERNRLRVESDKARRAAEVATSNIGWATHEHRHWWAIFWDGIF